MTEGGQRPGGLQASLSGKVGAFALDVEFAVPGSGVTALVGPSGSGKSTVLRALAGLRRFAGLVRIDGDTWQDDRVFLPPHKRAVGYVFQHAALLPHLTVRQNLDYGRRRAGASLAELDNAVRLVGLGPLLGRAPSGLSGGERQRVALARALVTRPRLLMLDEPLSGLDGAARTELLPELKRVLAALSIPVLYVSHDLGEVAHLADRIIRLEGGQSAASSLRATPTDELVGYSPDQIDELARKALRAGLG